VSFTQVGDGEYVVELLASYACVCGLVVVYIYAFSIYKRTAARGEMYR